MSSWSFKLPDYFMHYGPFRANNLEEARTEVRRRLGVKRLPAGVQIWDLKDRPMDRWRPVTDQPCARSLFATV